MLNAPPANPDRIYACTAPRPSLALVSLFFYLRALHPPFALALVVCSRPRPSFVSQAVYICSFGLAAVVVLI
jgi:hypothetical protein